MGVKDGLNVEAKGGVETSATPDTRDTWSGRFQLSMPLNKYQLLKPKADEMRRPGLIPGLRSCRPLSAASEGSVGRAGIGCGLERLLGERHLHDRIAIFDAADEKLLEGDGYALFAEAQKAAYADEHRDDFGRRCRGSTSSMAPTDWSCILVTLLPMSLPARQSRLMFKEGRVRRTSLTVFIGTAGSFEGLTVDWASAAVWAERPARTTAAARVRFMFVPRAVSLLLYCGEQLEEQRAAQSRGSTRHEVVTFIMKAPLLGAAVTIGPQYRGRGPSADAPAQAKRRRRGSGRCCLEFSREDAGRKRGRCPRPIDLDRAFDVAGTQFSARLRVAIGHELAVAAGMI